jgi:hypothetical protein
MRGSVRLVTALTTVMLVVNAASRVASANPTEPNLAKGATYLATATDANGVVGGTSLSRDGYYEVFDQFADFGLTIDGAFALAATGTDNATLQKVARFIDNRDKDGSGNSVDEWTGIGTAFANGGAIGKEALLAEVIGADPRNFGGHDLIAALDATVCTKTDVVNGCAAPGNYVFATSTFSQALGVIAALRAGDAAGAAAPVAYLESLQGSNGAWPSLIPSTGNSDVDSTAMAVMALALVPSDANATTAVSKALTWLAGKQGINGSFPGVAAASTNSTGLAIQALRLGGSTYANDVAAAEAFLAQQQNSDGGFNVSSSDPPGSDVRASTQALSGAVGTSFGTLSDPISLDVEGSTTTTTGTVAPASTTTSTSASASTSTVGNASTSTIAAAGASTSTTSEEVSDVSTSTGLPFTGSNTGRTLDTVGGLLVLGVAAILAGRPRNRSRRT